MIIDIIIIIIIIIIVCIITIIITTTTTTTTTTAEGAGEAVARRRVGGRRRQAVARLDVTNYLCYIMLCYIFLHDVTSYYYITIYYLMSMYYTIVYDMMSPRCHRLPDGVGTKGGFRRRATDIIHFVCFALSAYMLPHFVVRCRVSQQSVIFCVATGCVHFLVKAH